MSIYSVNRTGSMSVSQIRANESYTSHDFGRILYESAVNDQKMFDAILKHDFMEVQAVQEGTMLESELQALNERSVKEIVDAIVSRVKKFWEKIKGALKSAKRKIAAYIASKGKNYKKHYEDAKKKYGANISGEIELPIPNDKFIDSARDKVQNFDSNIDVSKGKDKAISVTFGKMLGTDKDTTSSEFRNKFMEKAFDTNKEKLSDARAKEMLNYIDELRKAVRDLDVDERVAGNKVKDLLDAAKAVSKDLKNDKKVKDLTVLVSVTETVLSTYCATVIKAYNKRIVVARKYINACIASMSKVAPKGEAAVDIEADDSEEAFEDVDTAVDNGTLDPEVEAEVDDVVTDELDEKCC